MLADACELAQTQKVLGKQTLGPVGLRSGARAFHHPGRTRPFPSRGKHRALVPAAAGARPTGSNSAPAAAPLAVLHPAHEAYWGSSGSRIVLSGFMVSLICLFF